MPNIRDIIKNRFPKVSDKLLEDKLDDIEEKHYNPGDTLFEVGE